MLCVCPQCGISFEKSSSHWNRSQKIGAPVYCGRVCAGLARRLKNPSTEAQRREAKAEYDRQYRAANLEWIKQKKSAWLKSVYAANPEKFRTLRKAKAHLHAEYCRQPWYRAWKHEYDQKYKARKDYGEFAEVVLLAKELARELEDRAGEAVNLDKATEKTNDRRKTRSEAPDGGQSEERPLGDAE